MCRISVKRAISFSLLNLLLAFAFGEPMPLAYAQQLSIRHYDVSDGLAHSHVSAMRQDAKGYLWVATWEGLSRFDGYRFTNYGLREGLGDPIVNDIEEDREGRIWVATNGGGVARLIDDPNSGDAQPDSSPRPKKKFLSFLIDDSRASNQVNALLFDSQNNLWCATDAGLYRAAIEQVNGLRFRVVVPHQGEANMTAFADQQGRLWFGIESELIEIIGDQIIKYGLDDGVSRYEVQRIIEDRQGRLLVANQHEVFEYVPPAKGSGRGQWRRLPLTLKPGQGINTLLSDSAGALWIGTWDGLLKYRDGKQILYTSAQGLSDNNIMSLAEDREGNLWIGTIGGGVCKLSSELIVSFTKTEGLPNQDVRKIFEDRRGHIYASISNGGVVAIAEGRAVALPESQAPPFSNLNERILQDRRGDWWIGTDAGLYHFHGPELQFRSGRKYTAPDGIAETSIIGFYEEPTGKIWVCPSAQGLFSFDPARAGPVVFEHTSTSMLTPFTGAQRMITDQTGALWFGVHGLLGKLTGGRVNMVEPAEGLPETNPRVFFQDSRGWLWIGMRYKGVSMTKDPSAANPTFVNYSTSNGLASDAVWAISEDNLGRMYLGTGKGLDQLDLSTGRIRHFNTDDGLAGDIINDCFKDSHGSIWVSTTLGLSKFTPQTDRTIEQRPPIYFSRVRIAGEELPLPETGAGSIQEVSLSPSRNNLMIEFVALSFEGEDKLRYQYKLEGVDADWSAPTESRSINYAHLAAGSYQFLVRAIDPESVVSDAAAFRFRILRPVWQQWWFIALAMLAIGLAAYAIHRNRMKRLIELERVRTRIATDLHDDIGANLSLIAILSEVARGQLHRDDPRMKEWFSTIATTSRDTVDAMSDIVWAVNPRRDHLRDLTQRMRRFAEDICGVRGIELQFRSPDVARELKLGADLRREVFLIFKESINNIVRHSGCSAANVELQITRGWLVLKLSDNGRGFDSRGANGGNGLDSMQLRAQKLGGSLEVISPNGRGATVTLKAPIDHRG